MRRIIVTGGSGVISFGVVLTLSLPLRCGNSASILEVRPGGQGLEIQEGDMYFNVFEAAPENDRDGPGQQASMNAGGKVSEAMRESSHQ